MLLASIGTAAKMPMRDSIESDRAIISPGFTPRPQHKRDTIGTTKRSRKFDDQTLDS